MATANNRSIRTSGKWPRIVLVLILLAAGLGWYYREPIRGYTTLGAAVGARNACSCRYVAGRPIGDCKKDFEPGMEMVFLSDDEEEKSVTGYVPLLASQTATYRDGYGCVLEPWQE